MKVIFFLFSLLLMNTAFAGWPMVEREEESVLGSKSDFQKIIRSWERRNVLADLDQNGLLFALQDEKKNARDFIEDLKRIGTIADATGRCFSSPEHCERKVIREVILLLRAKGEIDDLAGLILLAHLTNHEKQLNWLRHRKLDLPVYLSTLKGVARSRDARNAILGPTSLTKRSTRRKVRPWGKITPRQELFLKYDLFEIKVLTEILERAQKRITAQSISIIVDYDGDGNIDETIPVSPADRYRFAQNMLTIELSQETLSQGFLAGKQVAGPHLIMAASELGYVDEGILKELLAMPELQSKRSDKGKMYLNALWTIGKAGLMAVPGGIYFVLPVVIVESYFAGKKQQEKKDAPTIF